MEINTELTQMSGLADSDILKSYYNCFPYVHKAKRLKKAQSQKHGENCTKIKLLKTSDKKKHFKICHPKKDTLCPEEQR